MRIESVILRDVGPFKDARIDFPKGSDDSLADVYLLTGPNGSGKSTVLYAIAGAIGAAMVGTDHIGVRLRGEQSLVAVVGDPEILAVSRAPEGRLTFQEGGNPTTLKRVQRRGDGVNYYRSTPAAATDLYAKRVVDFRPGTSMRFDWAAFAYAGTRSLSSVEVRAVQDPTDSPFDRSLSFTSTANPELLVHWIASQQFKRLKAKEVGQLDRAALIERSISDIERTIGTIVEDAGFSFVPGLDDNNIRARYQGAVVELGVLPDGLKSIVSWVADLLMRLDRIPWVDNTPTMERSFLLLLDEIDIHLHPAWQRRVLPIVQRMFPNAQIIASTHSPFVVASAGDAHIITLGVHDGAARVESAHSSQQGVSYGAVLRSIFGVTSEFDVKTEEELRAFHEAKARLLRGELTARDEVDRIAHALATRSEELREIVGLELRQLERQQRLAQ